mgnify:CR=1 FL=1
MKIPTDYCANTSRTARTLGVLSIVDTLVSSNPRHFAETFSKSGRGDVAKARVAPLAVVENLGVFPNRPLGLGVRGITPPYA